MCVQLSGLNPSSLLDEYFNIADEDGSGKWELTEFIDVKRKWHNLMTGASGEDSFDEDEARQQHALLDEDDVRPCDSSSQTCVSSEEEPLHLIVICHAVVFSLLHALIAAPR